jgi:hypothetical protein
MNPTRQDHEANQTRKAQIKKHARPEKIQEKGPLRPFFLSPHAIHLSNMKRIVPTSNALFQHVNATFPCR